MPERKSGSLFEGQAVVEGLSDDRAKAPVGPGGAVEEDGLELVEIDLSVCQDGLVRQHALDLSGEESGFLIPADKAALERHGIALEDRRIDVGRPVDTDHCLLDLVYAASRLHTEVVRDDKSIHSCKGDRERMGLLDVLCRLVVT